MKHFARLSLLLLVFLNCATLYFAQNSKPSTSPLPSSGQPNSAGLPQTFTSEEGRFTISLPSNPPQQPHSFDTQGGHYESNKYGWFTNIGMYNVSYLDMPKVSDDPTNSKILFDRLRDSLLAKGNGRLKSDRDISLENKPGREIKIESSKGIYLQRFYLVNQRIYDLNVFLPNSIRSKESEAIKIFDSFKLSPSNDEAMGEVDRMLKQLRGQLIVGKGTNNPQAGLINKDAPPRVLTGKIISQPQPPYPAIAKVARVTGTVIVKAIVDEEGKVIAAQAESGPPLLRPAAVKAAYEVQFAPTLLDGKPVKVMGTIQYNFMLK